MKRTNLQATDGTNEVIKDGQLIDAVGLLENLFTPNSRPTLRWLRDQQKLRRVPYRKIGRLVFFDVNEVREAWRERFTVAPAKGVAV
jgi:hypothetical protein